MRLAWQRGVFVRILDVPVTRIDQTKKGVLIRNDINVPDTDDSMIQ